MQASPQTPLFGARRWAVWLPAAAISVLAGCSQPENIHAPGESPEAAGPRPGPISAVAVPTNGLIGDWRLDTTGASTVARDYTANHYNATVSGGATFGPGKPGLGNGLNLDNTDNTGHGGKYAQMPANVTLNDVQEGNGYTLSAWFNPSAQPPDNNLDNRYWAIVVKAGQNMGIVYNNVKKFSMRHYTSDNTLIIAQGSTIYSIGSWYHVAGVVSKSGTYVKVFVNGALQDSVRFSGVTAGRDYGSTPFQIGKAGSMWAANGKVDQVRIYNRALTNNEVGALFMETQSEFRFPLGMTKGAQRTLIGVGPMPDGLEMAARTATAVQQMLSKADSESARIALRVTRPNGDLANGTNFVIQRWKDDFDAVKTVDISQYVADGTLVGLFAIDEPFADFPGNMTGALLEQVCQYAKTAPNSALGWSDLPCLIRDKNTTLYDNRPASGQYQFVDGGWAQIADHHYIPANTGYNGNARAYFDSNLVQGRRAGLALMYGFNLLNGGREGSNRRPQDGPCVHLPDTNPNNCAMSANEVKEVADTLAVIGDDQGCGINGWRIDPSPGAQLDYYNSASIQSALQYLATKLGALSPLQRCSLR